MMAQRCPEVERDLNNLISKMKFEVQVKLTKLAFESKGKRRGIFYTILFGHGLRPKANLVLQKEVKCLTRIKSILGHFKMLK